MEKPYLNQNKECIPCFFPKYFNYGTKTCDSCPLNYVYDIV